MRTFGVEVHVVPDEMTRFTSPMLNKRNSFNFFVSSFVVLFSHISLCQPYSSFTLNNALYF